MAKRSATVLMCLMLVGGLVMSVATPAAAQTSEEADATTTEETVDLSTLNDDEIAVAAVVTDNRAGHENQILLFDEEISADVWQSLVQPASRTMSSATLNEDASRLRHPGSRAGG